MALHVNSIAWSLYTTLASDSVLVSSGVLVELQPVFNTDPNLTPWVGVYYDRAALTPRRIGGVEPYDAVHDLLVYCSAADLGSPREANDRMWRLLTPVWDAIDGNRTLDNTVQMIEDVQMLPWQVQREDEDYLFTMEVTLRVRERA